MPGSPRCGGRPLGRAAAALCLLFATVLAGCEPVATPPAPDPPPPAPSGSPSSATPSGEAQAAAPVRVRIPAIRVDAPVGPLDVDARNVLPPPDTNDGTGWWRAGPEPGERGPAVIAGHVDSYQGPAVFYRLRELRAGHLVHVDRADGSTVTFAVTQVERHAKDAFPTGRVYGDTSGPELRLITCGGEFDSRDRRYLDNVIVYARVQDGTP